MKYLLMLSFLVTVLGCDSTKKIEEQRKKEEAELDMWKGDKKSELIREWGAPRRYEDDGDGGEIMVYEKSAIIKDYGEYDHTKVTTRLVTKFTEFFVHADGRIYHWRTGFR
jgi:hypothetical protein